MRGNGPGGREVLGVRGASGLGVRGRRVRRLGVREAGSLAGTTGGVDGRQQRGRHRGSRGHRTGSQRPEPHHNARKPQHCQQEQQRPEQRCQRARPEAGHGQIGLPVAPPQFLRLEAQAGEHGAQIPAKGTPGAGVERRELGAAGVRVRHGPGSEAGGGIRADPYGADSSARSAVAAPQQGRERVARHRRGGTGRDRGALREGRSVGEARIGLLAQRELLDSLAVR